MQELLQQKERECVATAAVVLCLSRSDAEHIRQHLMPGCAERHPKVCTHWATSEYFWPKRDWLRLTVRHWRWCASAAAMRTTSFST